MPILLILVSNYMFSMMLKMFLQEFNIFHTFTHFKIIYEQYFVNISKEDCTTIRKTF